MGSQKKEYVRLSKQGSRNERERREREREREGGGDENIFYFSQTIVSSQRGK